MRSKPTPGTLAIFLCTALVLFALGQYQAEAAAPEMKLEIQLLWGTDKAESPDPKHKPVEPEVRERLDKLPLKWSHYFLVKSEKVTVKHGETKKVALSEKCTVDVKNVRASQVEVALYSKGEQLHKQFQALPKGEILILGGNAPNSTSWLVVIKRLE